MSQRLFYLAIIGATLIGLALISLISTPFHNLPTSVSVEKEGRAGVSSPSPPRTSIEAPSHAPHGQKHQTAATAPVSPPSDDELLAAKLAQLKTGHLAYSTPQKMKMEQTERVQARIGNDKVSITALKTGLEGGPDHSIATETTLVSSTMKMTLTSGDFTITNLSSEEQMVAGNNTTTWEWDIAPKHSGKLHLHLAAIVKVGTASQDYTTIDRTISVEVLPIDQVAAFFKANWQYILGLLGTGGAALWKLIADRRKKRKIDPLPWQTI